MVLNKRKILALSLTGQWHIDEQFALNALGQYIDTLKLLKEGAISSEDTQAILPISSSPSVGVVELKGSMFVEDSWCNYGAISIVNQLDELYNDPKITSIIMDVNSGGGESQAGYLIRDKIAERNKPVQAYVLMAGSAAYNAISTADSISLANEASQVGSIGSFYSINKDAVEEYKKLFDDVYATQSEEKNGAIRAYLKGDKSLLVKEATESAQDFINSVSLQRNIPLDSKIFKGGMYAGKHAIELGLADKVVGSMANLVKINQNQSQISNSNSIMNKFITALNRIFNFGLTETADEAQILNQLENQKSFAEMLNEAVTKQVSTLNEVVVGYKTSMDELITKVTGMSEALTTMKASVTTLTDENTKLVTEKAATLAANTKLEAEILELKSNREKSGIGSTIIPNIAAEEDFANGLRQFTIGVVGTK